MSPALVFAAALALIPALPKEKPATWINPQDLRDIPIDVALTAFDLMIDPKGRPVNCRITIASGSDSLDERVCQIFLSRGRFRPAKDQVGKSLAGVWSDRLVWVARADAQYAAELSPWDLTVPLPAGMPNREIVVGAIAVQKHDGSLAHCEIHEKSSVEFLNAKACEILSERKARIILDASGRPVAGIRTFTVAFYNK